MIRALLARARSFGDAPGVLGAVIGVTATALGSYLLHQYIGQQTEELSDAYLRLRKVQAEVQAAAAAQYPAAVDLDPVGRANPYAPDGSLYAPDGGNHPDAGPALVDELAGGDQ